MLVKHQTVTDNPSRRIYINNIEKKNIFKIETGYNPKVTTPETIRLLGKTGSRITKDENVKCGPLRNHRISISLFLDCLQ